MPKFYTCRTVTRPEEANPAKRLCLLPTVDGMACKSHAANPVQPAVPVVARVLEVKTELLKEPGVWTGAPIWP